MFGFLNIISTPTPDSIIWPTMNPQNLRTYSLSLNLCLNPPLPMSANSGILPQPQTNWSVTWACSPRPRFPCIVFDLLSVWVGQDLGYNWMGVSVTHLLLVSASPQNSARFLTPLYLKWMTPEPCHPKGPAQWLSMLWIFRRSQWWALVLSLPMPLCKA